jgi:hypothetical protein
MTRRASTGRPYQASGYEGHIGGLGGNGMRLANDQREKMRTRRLGSFPREREMRL